MLKTTYEKVCLGYEMLLDGRAVYTETGVDILG